MWLPQGGALKIENLQFTQYSIIMLLSSMLNCLQLNNHKLTLGANDKVLDTGTTTLKVFQKMKSAQKIMQVGVDVTCMHTDFGGCDLSGFGDIGTFKNGQISPLTHGL